MTEVDLGMLAEMFREAAAQAAPTTYGGTSLVQMQAATSARSFHYDDKARAAEMAAEPTSRTLQAIADVFARAAKRVEPPVPTAGMIGG